MARSEMRRRDSKVASLRTIKGRQESFARRLLKGNPNARFHYVRVTLPRQRCSPLAAWVPRDLMQIVMQAASRSPIDHGSGLWYAFRGGGVRVTIASRAINDSCGELPREACLCHLRQFPQNLKTGVGAIEHVGLRDHGGRSYCSTAVFGHCGRKRFPWENVPAAAMERNGRGWSTPT